MDLRLSNFLVGDSRERRNAGGKYPGPGFLISAEQNTSAEKVKAGIEREEIERPMVRRLILSPDLQSYQCTNYRGHSPYLA
jgi:hypothetical protein